MQVPSPGQLVTVRHRKFVVTEVRASGVQLDLYAPAKDQSVQHLVGMQSVEDDGLGEELSVVWEIEPGASVYENATLPDPTKGVDPTKRLDAFLDAVRWGAVASADVNHLNAPFRSGIQIEDYQLDPVARALQMPRVSLLIADDVGLGKTIEAGLVVQELMLRHRARSVLVVCPSGLQIQWRDQMRDKFGLDFRIVDSELMKDLRRRRGLHVNPWTHFPRLITSIDFLKRERPMRQMREALPPEGQPAFPRKFDLLIVDEAHNVAPPGRGQYAVDDSLRTAAIRTVAPHFEHKLFLTATPHNGYTESFAALLELLDDRRFHRGFAPDKQQLAAVMVRRLKRELPPDDLGNPRFPKRELEAIQVPYTEEERGIHRALTRYAELRAKGAEGGAESFATEFVLKLLKKRLFSSPEAFRSTLEKHISSVEHGVKKASLPKQPSVGILRREIERAEEEASDDDDYEEQSLEAVSTTTALFRPLSADERKLIDQMQSWAAKAAHRSDSKAKSLIAWLESVVRPTGKWGTERVIIFTEYRATQKWLMERLAAAGLAKAGRMATLYGGMLTKDREAVKAAFQASADVSDVRILLATDAASEGIDLQNECSKLVHYEIPWNPNRLEQRNGRVDRHGQRAKQVSIFHFVGEGYERGDLQGREPGDLEGDLEFLMRAAIKVDQIREDLGNAGDVIATQVEAAMLGKRRSLNVDTVGGRSEKARAMLQFERKLREELERLQKRLRESQEDLRLSPENVQRVVEVGLELAGHPPLRPVQVPGKHGQGKISAFYLPALQGSWAACSEGLAHPHTREERPIVFDHARAHNRDDVVLAHLNHRLVQMCLRLLRSEVWAPDTTRKMHRVSARVVPDGDLAQPVLLAHARLVVLGADNVRLHEELIVAGGKLEQGRLVRLNVGDTKKAFNASRDASSDDAPEEVVARLAELWPDHADQVVTALEARKTDRMRSLTSTLEERAKKETADVTSVLSELKRMIEIEIKAGPPAQLEMWNTDERQQLERNRDALAERARAVPDEIVRETAAIRARYAELTPRLFPVALTYVIPARLARRGS